MKMVYIPLTAKNNTDNKKAPSFKDFCKEIFTTLSSIKKITKITVIPKYQEDDNRQVCKMVFGKNIEGETYKENYIEYKKFCKTLAKLFQNSKIDKSSRISTFIIAKEYDYYIYIRCDTNPHTHKYINIHVTIFTKK